MIVKEGKNLPNNFGFGKADPMCIVSVNDLQQRTQIISNNLSPVWNKTMNFSVEQRYVCQSIVLSSLTD